MEVMISPVSGAVVLVNPQPVETSYFVAYTLGLLEDTVSSCAVMMIY